MIEQATKPACVSVCHSHEVVWVEFIVPVCLIIGVVHAECLMVDAFIVPLALLVEQVHLLRVLVRVDHVKIQASVLLKEGTEGGSAPVVLLRDRDQLLSRHVDRLNASELQSVELKQISLGVELQPQHETLGCECALHQKWKQRVDLGFVISGAKRASEGARAAEHLGGSGVVQVRVEHFGVFPADAECLFVLRGQVARAGLRLLSDASQLLELSRVVDKNW